MGGGEGGGASGVCGESVADRAVAVIVCRGHAPVLPPLSGVIRSLDFQALAT